jgi:hypothetical protein
MTRSKNIISELACGVSKNVEYSLERFIFVGPKPMPEEEWTKLCE